MSKLKFLIGGVLSLFVSHSYSSDLIDKMPIRVINNNIKQYYGDGENYHSLVVISEGQVKDIRKIPNEGKECIFHVDLKKGLKFQFGQTDQSNWGVHGNIYDPMKVQHSGAICSDIFTLTFQGDNEYSNLPVGERRHWQLKEFHFVTNRIDDSVYLLRLLCRRIEELAGDGKLKEDTFAHGLLLLSNIYCKYYLPIPIELNKDLNIDAQTHFKIRGETLPEGVS